MMHSPKQNKKTLWFLVGVVGGMILLGWFALLPHQFSKTDGGTGLGGLKSALTGQGNDFQALKSAAADLFGDLKQPKQTSTNSPLTNEQIRDLEQRVFNDQ